MERSSQRSSGSVAVALGRRQYFHLLSINLHAEENRGRSLRFFCVFGAFIFDLRGFLYAVGELYLVEQICVSIANFEPYCRHLAVLQGAEFIKAVLPYRAGNILAD